MRDGHDILLGGIFFNGGAIHPDGIKWYVKEGRPIPDRLLPGRLLEVLGKVDREAVTRAVNSGNSPASWYLKKILG
jgi:hypothetical protein